MRAVRCSAVPLARMRGRAHERADEEGELRALVAQNRRYDLHVAAARRAERQ